MNMPGVNIKIAVLGGDVRQIYTAMDLADRGYEVALSGFDRYDGDIGLCTRCSNVNEAMNNRSCTDT